VLVMELVEGQTLSAVIPEAGLPVAEAIAIARQIADALGAAHAAGIVHRDLKPGNVMISTPAVRGASGVAAGSRAAAASPARMLGAGTGTSATGLRVKILDFGLAKLGASGGRGGADEATLSAPLTRMGMVLGTLDYMSPEQACGQGVDARSDLFSFGAVLYEMLSGERPFKGDSAPEIIHRIVYEQPRLLEEWRPDLPRPLANLVHRMLEKAPQDRPQDARAIERELTAIAEGGGEAKARRNRPRGAVHPTRPALVGGLGGGLLVAASLAAWLAWRGVAPAAKGGAGGVAQANSEAGIELPKTAYDFYRQGQALLERYDKPGYVDRAIGSFNQAIGLDPKHAAAHAALAAAYRRKFREKRDPMWLDQAEGNARQALQLDEQLVASQVILGFVELERGQIEKAGEFFRGAQLRDPANAEARAGLAEVLLAGGDRDGADAAHRKAIELSPGDWKLQLMRGVGRLRAGDYPAALTALTRANELVPDSSLVLRNLGAAYQLLGRHEEASSAYQNSLQILPDPALYSNLGTLYFFRGLYREAVSAFERAVESGANDSRVWANLGDAYRWTGSDQDKASDAYLRATQLLEDERKAKPESIELTSRLATTLAKKGDVARAKAMLAEVPEGPFEPATLFRLGQAAEILQDRAGALSFIERALAAGYSLDEISHDPELTELRADVRFHRMLIRRGFGDSTAASTARRAGVR
jgi:serine/threonine-protein kinase